MCDVCGRHRCAAGCPNAEPEEIVCEECGRTLRTGDKYIDVDGYAYCVDCLDIDMLLDLFRVEVFSA